MHELGIYHGDICPAAVLWTQYGVRLLKWQFSGWLNDRDLNDVWVLCTGIFKITWVLYH